MLYYLIHDPKDDRLMIANLEHLRDRDPRRERLTLSNLDDALDRLGYVIKDSTEASGWVEAKKNFGYPLTSLQEMMLVNLNGKSE
jgi:hypothetical protein